LSGPVRDLDIAIESLKNEAVPARLRAWLEGRRARAFRQFIAQAPMLSPRFVLTLRVGGLGSAQARRIERRLMAQCDKLAPGIVHEAGRYHAMELDDRHELRRTIRRLRYLREVALPRRTQPKDALIQLLIGAQEALGEIQNCLVAEATLAQAQKLRGADALRAGLQQQRTAWERTAVRRLEMLLDWLQENGLDGG
jgi:CHAD domain-containing protein